MKYAKAYTAFLASVVAVVLAVLMDNRVDANELSPAIAQIVDAVLVLLASGAVAWVPNKNPDNTSK